MRAVNRTGDIDKMSAMLSTSVERLEEQKLRVRVQIIRHTRRALIL